LFCYENGYDYDVRGDILAHNSNVRHLRDDVHAHGVRGGVHAHNRNVYRLHGDVRYEL